jgi:ketosteroid isomerase-like protein
MRIAEVLITFDICNPLKYLKSVNNDKYRGFLYVTKGGFFMKNTYKMSIAVSLFFALILLLNLSGAYANTLKQELRSHIEYEFEAWNNKDFDKIVSMGYAVGFGFRSREPRKKDVNPESIRTDLKTWFDTIEYYKITPEEINILIDGSDIGLVYGFYIDEIKHKGQTPEKYRVRFSETYRKGKDGKWHMLLYHRDIQHFQENGLYIRENQE